jgi:hypothetical protein
LKGTVIYCLPETWEDSVATDNPEFRKRVEEAKARMAKLDELRIMVIKGHTVVEEAMDRFLDTALSHPQYFMEERPTFHFKGKIAQSLAMKEDKDSLWAVFWALNQLRNKIAHQIDSPEITEKMQYLRKTYIAQLGSRQKENAEKMTDVEIVENAAFDVGGLFGALTLDAKGRQAIIEQHWNSRSEQ